MALKNLFYDLGSGNADLFRLINNGPHSADYNQWMIAGSQLGHHTMFHYYAPAVLLIALIAIVYSRLDLPFDYPAVRDNWIMSIVVMFAAYQASHYWVVPLKDYFHYPRPFIALPAGSFQIIARDIEPKEYMRSFPSGHSIFIMMMAASLWPALESLSRCIVFCIVLWVGWSRIALGMHFPMDVLGGFLFSYIAVRLIRWPVRRLYARIKAVKLRKPLQKKPGNL